MRVRLISQFNDPVRGVSPYSDALAGALSSCEGLEIDRVDYKAPYPSFVHPAGGGQGVVKGLIHWANPISWRKAARSSAQVIHIQHWMAPLSTYLCAIVEQAKKNGARVVVTVHNPEPHEKIKFFQYFESRFLAAADMLVAHDRRGADALRSRGFDGVQIIPHGIRLAPPDLKRGADAYECLGLDRSRRYFCAFGNLRGYKGTARLLRAWKRICKEFPGVNLVVAGRLWAGGHGVGSHVVSRILGTRKEGRKVMAELDSPELLGRVHFMEGFIPDERIDALIEISDFSVFPYERFSSQSGAACRAAGQGCPVLVSDVGGLPDLAIGQDWIVPPGDENSLAAAMRSRLGRLEESAEWRCLQLESVTKYSWPRVAKMHVDLYRNLIC